MSDRTPTTEQVREEYATRMSPVQDALRRPEFDAWLASVKAEAWEEGRLAEELAWRHNWEGHPVPDGEICDECKVENPYRKETK